MCEKVCVKVCERCVKGVNVGKIILNIRGNEWRKK